MVEQSPYVLTEKQQAYYDFIRQFILKNDMSPSIYEVAHHFGVFPSTASRMIHKLDLRGYVNRPCGTRRTVKCLPIRGTKVPRP
jgi:Mn-dependent DtxR family transcriptional regulator